MSPNSEPLLLVEDDPLLLEILAKRLRKAGYEVATAKSGNEALKKVDEEGGVHLVVSDVRMSDGSGIDLLQGLRDRGLTLKKCVLMTGYSEIPAVDIIKFFNVTIVCKPLSFEELLRHLAA